MTDLERKDIPVSSYQTLTLMPVDGTVEFEIEDTQYTNDLVWLYLNETQVDEVIEFLQEWKNEIREGSKAG